MWKCRSGQLTSCILTCGHLTVSIMLDDLLLGLGLMSNVSLGVNRVLVARIVSKTLKKLIKNKFKLN